MKKIMLTLCLSTLIFISSISITSANDNKIEEMMERTGYPREAILLEIEKYAQKENISNETAELILYDAVVESTSYGDNNSLRSSGGEEVSLVDATCTDIFYSPSGTGHVGLYTTSSSIIEAPGIGRVVTEMSAKNKKVEVGTKTAGVSRTKGSRTRMSDTYKKDVIDFARNHLKSSYALTIDNKSCGYHDYNCSQLVWCSFKNGASLNVDASTDFFVTPSDIYHSDYVFYIRTL